MPFSNAYHGIQSSALMLLYAATTFVQHGRAVGEADAAACDAVVVATGPPAPPPPHAVARIAREATRTARVLVMFPPFPVSPDLWSPGLESVLDALDHRREEHSGARDEDHPREHLRRLECLARDGDELANTVLGRDELADDHAGERVPDAEPEPREDERHRARKHDAAEDQRVRRAEGSRDPQEGGLRVSDAGHRVDDDWEKCPQEDDRDLRLHLDAEPEDEERDEDDARCAVEEVHERVERVLESRVPAHEQPEGETGHDRHAVADPDLGAARPNVEPDVSRLEELHERLRDVPRTGHEEDGVDARVRDDLPGRERDDDAEGADDDRFVLLEPARLYDRPQFSGWRPVQRRRRRGGLPALDAHAAGPPAMSRSAGTASSSWIDSQISSS